MSRISLDVYSGRPNPQWELSNKDESDILDLLLMSQPRSNSAIFDAGLGYRGFDLLLSGAAAKKAASSGWSPKIRVDRSGNGAIDQPISALMADVMKKSGMEDAVSESATNHVGDEVTSDLVAASVACTIYKTSTTDLSYWNGASVIEKNNCYNFASNNRTNTFAQPGRGTGTMVAFPPTVTNVRNAAARDGYSVSCSGGSRIYVFLCIWPGNDYHWYRQTADVDGYKRWCHKPGKTKARNYDNNAHYIISPATCDRGPYTTDGGYMWGPGTSAPKIA